MNTRRINQDAGVTNPGELADMGSIFDATWRRLQAIGLVVAERETQQRNHLAGIIIRLMCDGQNISPDIVSEAAEDFRRSTMQTGLSAASLHGHERRGIEPPSR